MNSSTEWPKTWYDPTCQTCPRLSTFLKDVKSEHVDYFCKPVPPFGDGHAELLIVGLAPGKHGANATGRPFTGDYAGVLLYETLYKYGFANRYESVSVDDDLKLHNCRITNAVKCLPPQNKPIAEEERSCNHFLRAETDQPRLKVIMTLGQLAHRAILRTLGIKLGQFKFAHNSVHTLDSGILLVNSYHCSRYNTQTRRLTESMFHDVFETIVQALKQ